MVFEVLTAVVMKSSIFWNITPRSPLEVIRSFRGTCRLHLQGRRISQAKTSLKEDSKQSRGTYEEVNNRIHTEKQNMFLRNVDRFSTDYTALYPRLQNSSMW
jgi:hypothetical protein